MAHRVLGLEDRALELNNEFCKVAPRHYFERPQSGPDPHGLRAAWYEASDAVFEALSAVEHLADILRERAGLPDKPEAERAQLKRSQEARLTQECQEPVCEDEYDNANIQPTDAA